MEEERRLSPAVHAQLEATLDEMAEMLRAIRDLAESRGHFEEWWALVQQMIAMRVRLQLGPLDAGFEDSMEALCLVYDAFVTDVLPNPAEH